MWTINWILYEPIWKRCRLRFHCRTNINETLPVAFYPQNGCVLLQSLPFYMNNLLTCQNYIDVVPVHILPPVAVQHWYE